MLGETPATLGRPAHERRQRRPARAPPRGAITLAVTSGKGGVGKTNVVVNLAVALARLRNRVAILDADFGLGNVDVLLGPDAAAPPRATCSPATRTLDDIAGRRARTAFAIIPASSGLRELTALSPRQWERLNDGLDAAAATSSTSC